MPKLSQLTDYDPMGNFVGAQPVGEPTAAPSTPLSNNIDKILNSIFRPDEKRLQLWPERLVREGITAAGDVASGKVPTLAIDPVTGDVHTSPEMIEKAQAVSALAGTGGLASGGGSLNATPSLRPALKHNGKLYKGKPGQEHQDIIPDSLYKDFQKKAMSGEDLAEYNFGFYNDKGHFLSREDALKYGIDNGLIDPQAGKYGALTSTLFSDSSKPGVAIEAMKRAPNVDWSTIKNIETNLSPEASKTLANWVGGEIDAAKNGAMWGIFHREALKSPEAQAELAKHFQPLRDQLRKEHGDNVKLYRYHGDIPEGATPHDVLSFTNDRKIAEGLSGAKKERSVISDKDIAEKEAEFAKTGKVKIDNRTWLEKKKETVWNGEKDIPIEYIAIMRNDGMVTDTPSVRSYIDEINGWAKEHNEKRNTQLSKVKEYEIPIDDILAATDRFNQQEFVVKNTRKLFSNPASLPPGYELKPVEFNPFIELKS